MGPQHPPEAFQGHGVPGLQEKVRIPYAAAADPVVTAIRNDPFSEL
ncbi:hypothetical protein P7H21_25780 [Paenibacillus larvae]|nr:hypothetical protein [Paenibacillus larvae]MDT2306682.1 hypothetical protein [Paenibacillus larvae]